MSVVDARFTQAGRELMRCVMVHQIIINDSFSIAVVKNRRAEYLRGLECGRGRQPILTA